MSYGDFSLFFVRGSEEGGNTVGEQPKQLQNVDTVCLPDSPDISPLPIDVFLVESL